MAGLIRKRREQWRGKINLALRCSNTSVHRNHQKPLNPDNWAVASQRHWCIGSGIGTQESALQQAPVRIQTHSLRENHPLGQLLLDPCFLICLVNPIREQLNLNRPMNIRLFA